MLFSLEFAFFVPPRGLPSELFALGPIFFFKMGSAAFLCVILSNWATPWT